MSSDNRAPTDMPQSYRRSMRRCGHSREETEELWNRTCGGDFRSGDIVYIPEMTIIDGLDDRYGRVHSIADHKYLVVSTSVLSIGSLDDAVTDCQLVLLDGMHPDDPSFEAKIGQYNREHPEFRIEIPREVGLENDYFANAERLIMMNKANMAERGAKIMGHFPEDRMATFDRIAEAAMYYGTEKINVRNIPRGIGRDIERHHEDGS